jgi:hypothetical protein
MSEPVTFLQPADTPGVSGADAMPALQARKAYRTPELVECGPVSVLTLGLTSGPSDGLGGFLN